MSFEVESKPAEEDLRASTKAPGGSTIHASAKYATQAEKDAADAEEIARMERSEGRFGKLYVSGSNVRQTIFMLLDEPESGLLATIISLGVLFLIVASSTCFVVETMESVRANPEMVDIMHTIEIACIITFSAEYLLRVVTCSQRPREDRSVIKYLLKPMVLVDLVSIAPFYIELIIGGDESGLAVVRMLRMSRIFRCATAKLHATQTPSLTPTTLCCCPLLSHTNGCSACAAS